MITTFFIPSLEMHLALMTVGWFVAQTVVLAFKQFFVAQISVEVVGVSAIFYG